MHAAALAAGDAPRALPRETALGSLCHYISGADPAALPARQHHLRPAAAARRGHAPAAAARQAGAPRRGLPPRAGGAGRVPPRPCLSRRIRAGRADRPVPGGAGAHAAPRPHTLAAYARRPAPVPRVPLAARDRAARAGCHRPAAAARVAGVALQPEAWTRSPSAASWRPCAGCSRFLLREGVVRGQRGAPGAHAESAQKAARGDDRRSRRTRLIDGVAAGKLERPHPARDRAIFELLYGCGVRVSELAGLNLEDLDRDRALAARARQGPQGAPGAAAAAKPREALERYLAERPVVRDEPAVFLNHRGRRLTARGIHGIVKLYATCSGRRPVAPSAQLPPRLRHPSAGRRRRPARHPGTAGPRAPFHHPEVHPGLAHRSDGGVRQGASQGCSRSWPDPVDCICGCAKFAPMLRLAAPLALAELGWMAMGIVDTIMAGRWARRRWAPAASATWCSIPIAIMRHRPAAGHGYAGGAGVRRRRRRGLPPHPGQRPVAGRGAGAAGGCWPFWLPSPLLHAAGANPRRDGAVRAVTCTRCCGACRRCCFSPRSAATCRRSTWSSR